MIARNGHDAWTISERQNELQGNPAIAAVAQAGHIARIIHLSSVVARRAGGFAKVRRIARNHADVRALVGQWLGQQRGWYKASQERDAGQGASNG